MPDKWIFALVWPSLHETKRCALRIMFMLVLGLLMVRDPVNSAALNKSQSLFRNQNIRTFNNIVVQIKNGFTVIGGYLGHIRHRLDEQSKQLANQSKRLDELSKQSANQSKRLDEQSKRLDAMSDVKQNNYNEQINKINNKLSKMTQMVKCPLNWLKYQNRCFFVGKCETGEMCYINNMRKICEEKQATLAIISSNSDNTFIKKLAGEGIDFLVIGGRSDSKYTNWRWPDGSVFQYTNWSHGEPYNCCNYNCMAMIASSGKWGDRDCQSARTPRNTNFICERSIWT